MELIDIYDKNRNKTGRVKERYTEELLDGEYVLVVGALLINSEGKLLISKRSELKPSNPGLWEFVGGGSISGESSREAIIREIKEEIGIKFNTNDGIMVKSARIDHLIKDLWAFKLNVNIKDINFDKREITEVKWENIDNIIKLREEGKMIESNMVTKEDYKWCLEKLKI